MKPILLFLPLCFPLFLMAQRSNYTNKYAFGLAIKAGHSFPEFDRLQDRWRAVFYPATTIEVSLNKRIHERWMAELATGITSYFLLNRGSVDNYLLDFASPQLSAGLSYDFQNRLNQSNFIKLASGLQLGYRGTFVDEFETYRVEVKGNNPYYPFLQPEMGIRRYTKKKMKGSRYKMAYELGTYFRYNFRSLGTATITENDFTVTLEPRGNIIGVYFRLLFPTGRKRMKIQATTREKALPPIIYHPRSTRSG